MAGRIGTLHLHYHARGNGALAALVPGLDRALQSRLGEAVDERLATVVGADPTVVVIKELNARVTLGRADWSLDSRVVEKISRASIDAVAAALAAPASPDSVVRFADQAEFVGSFILDLLNGSAWERWYYGAFQRYRGNDARTTICAVLEDNRAEAAAVLGWLARRGQLEPVLALIGPRAARRLATACASERDESLGASEVAPLVAAAFHLLEALGWPQDDDAGRTALVAEYIATAPLPPAWTDRRSLSAWVLGFVQFVASAQVRRGTTRTASGDDRLRALLRGTLDWLDVAWLEPQLDHLREGSRALSATRPQSVRRVLTSRHEQALERLAELVRQGRIPLDRTSDLDVLIVRLVAAIAEGGPHDVPPDRALVAIVEHIADAWRTAISSGIDAPRVLMATGVGSSAATSLPRGHAALVRQLDGVRAAGPAAVTVLQQLLKTAAAVDGTGDLTHGGGLFLLTRGILDVKLRGLAHAAGVPFESLLGALANQWLGLVPPLDGPTRAWIGAERLDGESLDAEVGRLADLQESLLDLLRDQRTIETLPPDESLDLDPLRAARELGYSATTAMITTRIAWMVFRAWSRWLPGLSGATPSFLVRNCLQRPGRVRESTSDIAVQLDPAPFDVVLEMAGYYRPIELVPWLNHRRVTFTVRRHPGA